ncbi:MAG: DUF222 domain-containing protein, partial [Actinomycetota bacterium]|nr:DUF222 domain-containing protein [Actinomycetota bacterium]
MYPSYEDPLDELETALEKVLASDYTHDLSRLRKILDRGEVVWLRAVGAAARAGELNTSPRRGPAAELADRARMTPTAAARDLSAARRLDDFPVLAGAFVAGDVRRDHVQVLTQAATTPERVAMLQRYEDELVQVAKTHSARNLSTSVGRLCDAADGDDGSGAANALHDKRGVYLSPAFRGMGVLNGQLDPEQTEHVITAFEHRMTQDPDLPGERKRTRPQRRADALADICRWYS